MNSIANFFQNLNYSGWQTNIKVIFSFLTFIFLALAIYSYIRAHLIASGHGHGHGGGHGKSGGHDHVTSVAHETETPVSYHNYTEHWQQIRKYVESIRDSEWKLSVIEADKLVDGVLQEHSFPGETMGERLMLIKPDDLSSLQDLWDAHKLRNLLVHEISYNLRHEQAIEAINAFEKVLRELGAIS